MSISDINPVPQIEVDQSLTLDEVADRLNQLIRQFNLVIYMNQGGE